MALACFKDLCLDVGDPVKIGRFWAEVLDLTWQLQDDGDSELHGPTPQHTIWVNRVPEAKAVKNRAHLNIYAERLDDLIALGSAIVRPEDDGRPWTVMADPEGGEYCAFLRPELPADRLHGLVVDAADAAALARWWAGIYDAAVEHHPGGHSTVHKVPGMPILTMDFVSVPEPKTAKNRVHWDVTVPGVQPLLDAGATLLALPTDQSQWHVLADPEGNEFCAFTG
jgi:Glyoxalase-like domain